MPFLLWRLRGDLKAAFQSLERDTSSGTVVAGEGEMASNWKTVDLD